MKLRMILLPTLALVLGACGGASAGESTGPASSHAEEQEATHDGDRHDDTDLHETAEEGDRPVDRMIEISATDFAFDPASIEVVAGETVEFVVTNDGTIDHEFRLTSHHAVQEHLEAGHADHGDDEGDDEGDDGHAMMVVVPPGETASLVMTFAEAAEVELFACLLPGHYEAGMEGDLRIES